MLLLGWIGGPPVLLNLFVTPGQAPLLISKPAMKTLEAKLEFGEGRLRFNRLGTEVNLKQAGKGHYVMDLCELATPEVMESRSWCVHQVG